MRSLFISHTGMTEPLGQSQVIPYVAGLARRGAEMTILSFEPIARAEDEFATVHAQLAQAGVDWIPLQRSASHAAATKMWESAAALTRGLRLSLRKRPHIIHARSYLPGAVADVIATSLPRTKLLFDCRGMLGDEYADTGYWQRTDARYRIVKRYERRLFRRADATVVLTDALRRWLIAERLADESRLVVIPCCVDTQRFQPDEGRRRIAREALGLGDRLVVLYAGSLGTYYLEQEMARFVSAVRRRHSDAVFLVLTHSVADSLVRLVRREGVPARDIMVRSVSPADMPTALSCGDIGLSFILESFSKKGSSPTKVAEYLAAGVPVVLNASIGDQAELDVERQACVVVRSFDDDTLANAARDAIALARRPFANRSGATTGVAANRFDLEQVAMARYEQLYRRLTS